MCKWCRYAYARFAFQSGKSQVSDSEDSGYAEEESESAGQKQAELRETGYSSEEARTELGLAFYF